MDYGEQKRGGKEEKTYGNELPIPVRSSLVNKFCDRMGSVRDRVFGERATQRGLEPLFFFRIRISRHLEG